MTERGSVSAVADRPEPVRLGLGTRAALRAKHTLRLGREVSRYGAEQRLWWLLPAVVVLLLLAVAVTTTTSALPVAVYALF
jgi:hypothetical protein